MNTFKHRQCYEIITSLDDIHPFKVLDNGNASDMNIIKFTSYNRPYVQPCSAIVAL